MASPSQLQRTDDRKHVRTAFISVQKLISSDPVKWIILLTFLLFLLFLFVLFRSDSCQSVCERFNVVNEMIQDVLHTDESSLILIYISALKDSVTNTYHIPLSLCVWPLRGRGRLWGCVFYLHIGGVISGGWWSWGGTLIWTAQTNSVLVSKKSTYCAGDGKVHTLKYIITCIIDTTW